MPVLGGLIRENPAPLPCDHCGSRVPEALRATGFCCSGCEAVAALLRTEGLHRYYELAGRKGLPVGAAPAERAHTWLEPLMETAANGTGNVCSLELDVQGIHCAGCVWLMNETFRRTAGAVSVIVNPTLGKVRLVWHKGVLDPRAWVMAIERFGYRFGPERKTGGTQIASLTWRLGLCVALSMNVMLFSISFYFGLSRSEPVIYQLFTWASLLLSSVVVVVGGGLFFRSAWLGLRRGVLAMDLPIALGIALVFGASVTQVVSGRGGDLTYFDTLNTFVTLMVLGRWLQQKAIERNRTLLLEDDGAEDVFVRRLEPSGPRAVRAPQLRKDDRVLVAPGELVPVEATLLDAHAAISTDWITGESQPQALTRGQSVPAGSFNAGRSAFTVQNLSDFSQSPLNALLRAPVRPQDGQKIPLWDRLARVWSLSVLLLAAGGFLLWRWLDPGRALDVATSLLVITCPCALGISLPLARELVQLRLRKQGFFARDPGLFDKLVNTRHLLFDKTGTLTLGRMELDNLEAVSALPQTVRSVAYTMAAQSAHPVASCVARALADDHTPWMTTLAVKELPGQGLQALTDEGTWRLGKAAFALGHANENAQGSVLTVDFREVARFTTREVLRADAAQSVATLTALGYSIHLLSGDHPDRVKAMALRLGVPASQALGGLSPEQKALQVAALDHGDTLFLGDGVNDTLAFDRANVAGTVAVDRPVLPGKAHFFLLGEGLSGLTAALQGAQHLRKVTLRLLALSLTYNAFAITACVAGLMTPLLAAVTMPGSSLFLLGFTLWSVDEAHA